MTIVFEPARVKALVEDKVRQDHQGVRVARVAREYSDGLVLKAFRDVQVPQVPLELRDSQVSRRTAVFVRRTA